MAEFEDINAQIQLLSDILGYYDADGDTMEKGKMREYLVYLMDRSENFRRNKHYGFKLLR